MYTKEQTAWDDHKFHIIDPDGDCICIVKGEAEADALLSHLNRG